MIDVLVGAELTVLSDEETMRTILRISLHHLIFVVLLESSRCGGVEHLVLREELMDIGDDFEELSRRSVQKETVSDLNELLLRSHCSVLGTKKTKHRLREREGQKKKKSITHKETVIENRVFKKSNR